MKLFVLSVTKLVRSFRDPKMTQMLTDPRTQQQPFLEAKSTTPTLSSRYVSFWYEVITLSLYSPPHSLCYKQTLIVFLRFGKHVIEINPAWNFQSGITLWDKTKLTLSRVESTYVCSGQLPSFIVLIFFCAHIAYIYNAPVTDFANRNLGNHSRLPRFSRAIEFSTHLPWLEGNYSKLHHKWKT